MGTAEGAAGPLLAGLRERVRRSDRRIAFWFVGEVLAVSGLAGGLLVCMVLVIVRPVGEAIGQGVGQAIAQGLSQGPTQGDPSFECTALAYEVRAWMELAPGKVPPKSLSALTKSAKPGWPPLLEKVPLDEWHHPFQLRTGAKGGLEVASAGPDGVFGTTDDYSARVPDKLPDWFRKMLDRGPPSGKPSSHK